MLLILCGNTASGKDTYQNLLLERNKDLERAVSYTTRPIRKGEEEGREYFFLDAKSFRQLDSMNFFIETREYITVENDKIAHWHYGLPRARVDETKKSITILDHQGILELLREVNGEVPVKVVYLKAPVEILRERSLARNDESAEFERRLADDISEFRGIENIADLIIETDVRNHEENLKAIEDLIRDGGE